MTTLPEKELLRPDEVARIFRIGEELLSKTPSLYEIIAKRERRFLDKVLIPWVNKQLPEGFICVRNDDEVKS